MTDTQVALQLQSQDEKGWAMRFDDYLAQLSALQRALAATDRLVGKAGPSVYFKILHFADTAPATLILEAVPIAEPDIAATIVETFFAGLAQIAQDQVPPDFDPPTLNAFRNLWYKLHSPAVEIRIVHKGDFLVLSRSDPRSVAYVNEDELPTLADLFGVAPDATGGKPSEEFIRDLRGDWT